MFHFRNDEKKKFTPVSHKTCEMKLNLKICKQSAADGEKLDMKCDDMILLSAEDKGFIGK